jgi:peptidoglycan hydrolase-like protein with peptidoglycan-binding domain
MEGHPLRGLMHGLFRELREKHGRWGEHHGRWLARGSVGERVKKLQQALNVAADGFFGPQTEEAVKQYQAKNELKVDGVCGPLTWSKLFPEDKKESESEESCDKAWRKRGCGRWLVQGMAGRRISRLQEALNITVDGFFGPQTVQAVKEFQAKRGLLVDGVCGPATLEKLFPEGDAEEKTGESNPHHRWLRRGAIGEEVKTLQQALGITPVDGMFGPRTKRAVKEYQAAHGLPVDGWVGPRTWAKLAETKPSAPAATVVEPAATAPQAPAATPVDPAMEVLLGMGFTDVEANARLLKAFKGDVEQVIAEILGANH